MVTIRPAAQADIERILFLGSQAFNAPTSSYERTRKEIKLEDYIVAELNGAVVGTARTLDFAHFYGGRAVRASGVASVSVAAEARGRAIGTTLMRELLQNERDKGTLISSLYPATVPIYRSVGYGFGSVRAFWTARLKDLPQHADHDVAIEDFGEDVPDELNATYERIAAGTNGLLRRSPEWWRKRVLTGHDDRVRFRYLVREAGEVTGWIVYSLESGKQWGFALEVRDLFWTTPRAGRALLSLASLHRSTGEKMNWVGPPNEPLVELLRDHTIELDNTFDTMIRLVDVPGAIEARGYSPHVDASVSIGVHDELLADNQGPWRIEVSGGSAKVAPTDRAEARARIDVWGSIWSGLLSARDAVRTGGLEASEEAIVALDAMFAGPMPWIADFF